MPNSDPLTELGWQPFFENQISVEEKNETLLGRVSAHWGSQIELLTATGSVKVETSLLEKVAHIDSEFPDAAGLGERENGTKGVSPLGEKHFSDIAVGDWFLVDRENHRGIRRLDRKTLLTRKAAGEKAVPQRLAANVDTVFIVCSLNNDFNLSRIERYLALIVESNATPVVVLTKADLCDQKYERRQEVEKLMTGLIVETLDARDPEQTAVLSYWCSSGKTIALLGSSGVGKSTLVNSLAGAKIEVQEIREDDSKGRHTTTFRSMHRLNKGGWLIDTPGMRELQLTDCQDGLKDVFDEVVELAEQCQFRNCQHQAEPGCAIQNAIQNGELDARRWRNYQKLMAEQERNNSTLAERRDRERKTGQYYKQVQSAKRRQKGAGDQ